MKDKAIQITHSELFDIFENESIEESFIASDNIKNILLSEGIEDDEILNFPYLSNDLIIITCVNGFLKAEVDTKLLELSKNSVFVILPKKTFEIKEISPDFKSLVLIMKTNFWDNKNIFIETVELQQHFFKENSIHLSANVINEFITIYNLIKQKLAEKGPFRKQIIQNYINIMFYNVYALLRQEVSKKELKNLQSKEYIFERFIRLVQIHYKEHHNLEFYARQLNFTSKYLSSIVREVSGNTASHWIHLYLLNEARALLKMGKMSIKQISNELNFYDQSHFGVFFKKHIGCSPKSYQEQ